MRAGDRSVPDGRDEFAEVALVVAKRLRVFLIPPPLWEGGTSLLKYPNNFIYLIDVFQPREGGDEKTSLTEL